MFSRKIKQLVRPHIVRFAFSRRSGFVANNLARIVTFVDERRRYQILRAIRMQLYYSLNKKTDLHALCWEEVLIRPKLPLLRHLIVKSSVLLQDQYLIDVVLNDKVAGMRLGDMDLNFLAARKDMNEVISKYCTRIIDEARTRLENFSPRSNPAVWNYYLSVLIYFEIFDVNFPPDIETQLNEGQVYRFDVYNLKKLIFERKWPEAEKLGKTLIERDPKKLEIYNLVADISLYTGSQAKTLPWLLEMQAKHLPKLKVYNQVRGLNFLQDDDIVGYLRLREASPINTDIVKHISKRSKLIAGSDAIPYSTTKKKKSLFVIGRDGVGDEVRWAQFYGALPKYYSKIDISCDPRLEKIFIRSFPKINFHPVARNWGRVNAQTKDLSSSKIPSLEVSNRLNYEAFKICRQAGEVTFTEDVALRYYLTNGVGPVKSAYLHPRKEDFEYWNRYVNKIAKRKLKIGIIWRSGLIDAKRSLHYLKLSDFSGFVDKKIKMFSLQHEINVEEIELARKMGVHIFGEDVDLYNDFETILSLCATMDCIVGISTLPLELGAASGTPVKMCIVSPFGKLMRSDAKSSQKDRLSYNTELYFPDPEIGFNRTSSEIANNVMSKILSDIKNKKF